MGLFEWLAKRRGDDVEMMDTSDVAAGPFRGEDGHGLPVAQFTPDLVESIRVLSDRRSLGHLYRTMAPVRICVNLLANNIAHCKLKSYRRTSDSPELLYDEPLDRLLDQPNPRTSGYDLIHGTVADVAIYDTAYWLKLFVGNAREIYRLPPELITPIGGDILSGPTRYELATTRGPRSFGPSEIVDFSGYNPWDTRIGSPPLQALRAVLTEEYEASRWRAKFWTKGARIGGVIERPFDAPSWNDNDRKRFRDGWRRFTRGADLEEESGVLEDGMKYNPATFSPKDSEFMAGRNWALDMTATIFGIPLAVLSRTSAPTFASMKEFHKMLYVDTLGPWMARIERTLCLQLLPDFDDPDLYVEFNIEEKLQGDEEEQANSARNSVQVPWLSVNEMRALRGKPRIEDDQYDIPARPANYLYGEPVEVPPTELELVGAQAAMDQSNGHDGIAGAELERILEER